MKFLLTFFGGALFGTGLILAGMTQPSKVVDFLDFTGNWDPSLAFVMVGAIVVYMPSYKWITRRDTPIFEPKFILPTRKEIDVKLVIGASLFGVGWGLGGFCPGPALTASGSLLSSALLFTAAMLGGFLLYRIISSIFSSSS